MSDPVTNVDIEDVLSSIRRLVSDEHRSAVDDSAASEDTAQAAPKPQEIEPDPEGARLLLTPALRVDTPSEQGEDHDQGHNQDHGEQGDEQSGKQAEVAADDAQNHHDHDTDIASDEAPQTQATEADSAPAPAMERSDVVDTMAEQTEGADEPYEAAEGDVFAVSGDDILMDWSDVTDDDNVVAFFAQSPAVAAERSAAPADSYEDEDDSARDPVSHAPRARPTVADVLAEEAAPEHDAQADMGTDLGMDADPINEFSDDAQDGDAMDFDDAAVLDEAGLRELVNQLVREELQGALGERITRNVRKLVRREIQRALVSKDLE